MGLHANRVRPYRHHRSATGVRHEVRAHTIRAPRLLPNGQPDQFNIICSEQASRQIAAAIARGLPAFARR